MVMSGVLTGTVLYMNVGVRGCQLKLGGGQRGWTGSKTRIGHGPRRQTSWI